MLDMKARILLVDDMPTMRKIVMKCLKQVGYENCVEANDGAHGWEVLQSSPEPIQAIISDWNMPNLNGLEFLKKVRGDARFKTIPFVFVSAEGDPSFKESATQAGMTGYILKPFTPESLRQQLQTLLSG